MNRSVRLSSAQSFCSNAVSFNSRWIWIGKSSTFLWGYWKKNKSHFRNFELCWKYPKQILFMTIFAGAVTFSSNPLVFTHFTVFSNVLSLTACRMGLKLYLCMLTCSHVWHHEPVWNTKFSVVKKNTLSQCAWSYPWNHEWEKQPVQVRASQSEELSVSTWGNFLGAPHERAN